MHRNSSKRGKVAVTFVVMLLTATFMASLLPEVTAVFSSVEIVSIDPPSGPVGETVRIIGGIDTPNGSYQILFDGKEVDSGNATGTAVNVTFTVPLSVEGSHNVTLFDVTAGNQSLPEAFTVTTSYYVSAKPTWIQEGLNTAITMGVNEAEANATYAFTINVTDPQSAIHTAALNVSTNATGSGSNSTFYPENFLGANTNYVGNYTVAVIAINETLATGNFTVGLTDELEYNRGMETVSIRGAGYGANETVTVDIKRGGVSVDGYPKNITANANGVVNASWNIPISGAFGTYTVTLVNATPGTVKEPADTQDFWITERMIIDPISGGWGTTVRVVGEILTVNGSYQILWDGKNVGEGTCEPDTANVDANFTVPPSVKGYYNITLYDVNQSIESMPATFEVMTSCYVSAEPARILEGFTTTITVGIDEAKENTIYTLMINVTDPVLAVYTATLIISIDATGSGSNSTLYYGNFSDGANTNYVGEYNVTVIAVDETLANGSFTVGLTDELEYRTTNEVIIRGSGYAEGETVTANITCVETGETVFLENRNATDGVVSYKLTIPGDATLGIYTLTLSNATTPGTVKPILDIQNFTVIEIIVHCQARNKYDNESLAGVTIEAYVGTEMTLVASGITNETGVDLRIDRGNYTFKALWKGETVGVLSQNVTGNATEYVLQQTFDIECELTHVTIAIIDEADPPQLLPFINVTLTSPRLTEALSFETNYTGTIALNTFTNTSYTIEARRYGHLFNTTQVANLTITRWINITCPTLTLFVNVLDSKGIPLKNVEVEVYEWSSGVAEPVQSETTDNLGSAVFHCTFGKYKIWVYNEDRTIVLNKTVVDLTKDQFFVIHCKIFNMDLRVIVKDYFGHPISNALVEVNRENATIDSQKTGSNGTASFYNLTGGDCQISVSIMGKPCETRTLYLDETKVIVFKLENFVVVGGYPLEVTQLIATISLGIVITVFALALIYRRLRLRKVHKEK